MSMEVTQNEETKEPKVLELRPLTKGKRSLVFLADFFLVFIFSLLIFHIGIYPLGRVIVDYPGQLESLHKAQERRDGILYGYELLFPSQAGKTAYGDYEDNLAYTCDEYIHHFVDPSYEPSRDVFKTYFVDLRKDSTGLQAFYEDLAKDSDFLEVVDGQVRLKDKYVQEFAPNFNPDDAMSSQGKADYASFGDKVFVRGYGKMHNDIMDKDLVRNEVSYKTEQTLITKVLSNSRSLVATCAFLTFFIMWLIDHILVPFTNRKRKTLGMLMMRVERIHKGDYGALSLPLTYLGAAYALAGEAACVLFVPWGTVDFNELFSLPGLFVVALFSLIYIIGSLIYMLIDPLNRTLGDLFTRSHFLSEDQADALARERGYGL